MEKGGLIYTGFKLLLKQEKSVLCLRLVYNVSWLQFASWPISDHLLLDRWFCFLLHRSSTWHIIGKLFFLCWSSSAEFCWQNCWFDLFLENTFDPDLLLLPILYCYVISIYTKLTNLKL